jgi:serine/threonine protein kinase
MIDIGVIGKRSFGQVLLIKDRETRDLMDVKSINFGPGEETKFFRRDVGILAELRHPCILRLVGCSLPTRGRPVKIGMEYERNGRWGMYWRPGARALPPTSWMPTKLKP